MLEKDGKNKVAQFCEKWELWQSQGGQDYPTYNKMKANWISHICLVEHIIEGKIEGGI